MTTTTTSYELIYDLFLTQINDYRLTALYNLDVANSTSDLDTLLQGWLFLAIPDFEDICTQDLEDRDDTTMVFNYVMTTENQQVLAFIMMKYWLRKETHDILQMRLHVQDKDFKTYAEQANLNSKSAALTKVTEEISQKLVDYGYKHADWQFWITDGFQTLQ